MDVFLIIITIIMGLLLLYVNIYLLALYCHPEDRGFGTSCICKIIVVSLFTYIKQVFGLTLSWAQALLLPVDVANIRYNSGMDMLIAWQIIYVSILVTSVLIIPFSIFFYESDEDKAFVIKQYYSIIVFSSVHSILPVVCCTSFGRDDNGPNFRLLQ